MLFFPILPANALFCKNDAKIRYLRHLTGPHCATARLLRRVTYWRSHDEEESRSPESCSEEMTKWGTGSEDDATIGLRPTKEIFLQCKGISTFEYSAVQFLRRLHCIFIVSWCFCTVVQSCGGIFNHLSLLLHLRYYWACGDEHARGHARFWSRRRRLPLSAASAAVFAAAASGDWHCCHPRSGPAPRTPGRPFRRHARRRWRRGWRHLRHADVHRRGRRAFLRQSALPSTSCGLWDDKGLFILRRTAIL